MDYLSEFENYLIKEKNASDSTLTAYMSDCKEMVNFLMEQRNKQPQRAGMADIAAYMNKLKTDGRSSSTINRKMSSVRAFYGYMTDKKYVNSDPTKGIKSPKTAEKSLDYLTIEEIDKLLTAPDETPLGLRNRAVLELMYATGMRASEVTFANVSDLNLRIGFISCSNEGKTRIVPIGKLARTAIEEYLDKGRPNLLHGDNNTKALFLNFQGQRISRQGIWKIIKFYGEQTGIEKPLSPQILRNSFAVHMLQNGADLKSLQDLLGLEDINAVKLYLSVTKNRIMDVYDRTHPRA